MTRLRFFLSAGAVLVLVLVLALGGAVPVCAQDSVHDTFPDSATQPTQDSGRTAPDDMLDTARRSPQASLPPSPMACHGEIVSRIDVHPTPPFPLGGPRFVSSLAALAGRLHSTTNEQIIRRFITLREGAPCTEVQRLESERILRAQPYLAAARVAAYPDGKGGVVIDVTTIDEISLVLGADGALTAPLVRGLRLGEANLAGEALYVVGAWQHNPFRRDSYRGQIIDYQFLGQPDKLLLQGARNALGGMWEAEASRPFLVVTQSNSWRVAAGSVDRYVSFLRPDGPSPALQFERVYADAGGVHAFGARRRRVLLGGSVSRERERTAFEPVFLLDSAVIPDTSGVLRGRYGDHQQTRLNLLFGFRNVEFMPVSGFDAVEGVQDVRTGFQFAGLVGRGMKFSARDEPDYLFSTDVYLAGGTPTSFVGFEALGERRRDLDPHRWDGALGSGRLAWYRRTSGTNTLISDVQFGGGWRQRVPFQLTLADPEGGLRGYNASQLGGAQRLTIRVEERHRFGRFRQFGSLAAAAFVDGGKLWAGDSPYGVTTGMKYAAGVSLLAAVPPKSRRTWRIDFAAPLNDRHDSKFEVRVSNLDFTRWFWREPSDVQLGREQSIPNSVYNWP